MEEKHSWLDGSQIPGELDNPNKLSDYPGRALGLAPDSPGSQAMLMYRVGDILTDWIISLMIVGAFSMFFGSSEEQIEQFGDSLIARQSFLAAYTPAVFLIIGTVSVWLFTRTPGQRIMRMSVTRVDKPGERAGFVRTFFHSLLTLFLLPPVITDSDMRGMYDCATGTVAILG